jgi:hypothetical protein
VQISITRKALIHQVKYLGEDESSDEDTKRIKRSKGGLTSADNQRKVEFANTVKCKLIGKSGQQVKHEGIVCMDSVRSESEATLLSFVRGKSNVVQVFSPGRNEVVGSFDYSQVLEEPIRGFHAVE